MNITENLARISNAKDGIKQALRDKGVAVSDSALLDEYPTIINNMALVDPYYKVFFDQRTNNSTNMKGLFQYCTAPELDLSNIDTGKVTDMSYTFASCTSSINIDGWDTSNVTNAERMFNNFTNNNKYLDLSILDFSNITNANYMFEGCYIDHVDIKNCNLDFSKITDMKYSMFSCIGTVLDLSNLDITGLKNMSSMFYSARCKKIDLTNWITTNVTSMSSTFGYNSILEELIIPDWDMTNVSNSMSGSNNPFFSCDKLRYIDTSRCNAITMTKLASILPKKTQATFGTILAPYDISQEAYDALVAKYWRPMGTAITPVITNTVLVITLDELVMDNEAKLSISNNEPWYGDDTDNVIEYAFSDNSVANINLSDNTITPLEIGTTEITVVNKETKEVISTEPVSLTVLPIGYFDFRFKTTDNKGTVSIYINSTSSTNVTIFDPETNEWVYKNKKPITKLSFNNNASYITEITNLHLSKHITTMSSMFKGCKSLTSLNVSNFNTSNVTNMNYMFNYCNNLTSLDVSNFNTSNVTNMEEMFSHCESLTQLDLSNFNTSNVTNMDSMFQNCQSLTSLDVSNFNTSNVTNMNYIFSGCTNLTSLDISNFDTSKITNMSYMFSGCGLKTLDISNFDASKVTNTTSMFINCNSLQELRLDNCSNHTIGKIINSSNFPTNTIKGVTRTIYCKEANTVGLTPPTNWVFSYVD